MSEPFNLAVGMVLQRRDNDYEWEPFAEQLTRGCYFRVSAIVDEEARVWLLGLSGPVEGHDIVWDRADITAEWFIPD